MSDVRIIAAIIILILAAIGALVCFAFSLSYLWVLVPVGIASLIAAGVCLILWGLAR